METEKNYNAKANQTVELEFPRGAKLIRVFHVLSSLSDERWKEFDKQVEKQGKKMLTAQTLGLNLDTFLAAEKEKIWNELAVERKGYKETPDWREKTNILHKISAITALLFCQPFLETKDDDEILGAELLDDEEIFDISLRTVFDGQEIITHHFLRTETTDELNEYLAILSGQPQKNVLASASKLKADRYAALYDAVCQTTTGYHDDMVPIWHKIEVIIFYFEMKLQQLKKF